MKVNFYPRPRTQRDEISIQGVIRWNKQKLAFTVLESVTVKNWNSDSQEVRKSDPQAFEKNARLKSFEGKAEALFNQFVVAQGIEPTKNELRELIKPTPQAKKSEAPERLFDFIDFVIEGHAKRLASAGKPLNNQSVVNSYKQTKQLLMEFRPRMDFDDVSLDWYFQFLDYCLDEKQYTRNNTGKHVKNVKAIMNEALSEGVTTNTAHKSKKFKVMQDEVDNIYLNREELARIEELNLAHLPQLEEARDLFLLGCWTGLRISDFKRIQRKHIRDGRFIAIRTQKTDDEVEIPLHPTAKAILEKYDFKLPQMADQTLNYRIKEVGLLAGIDSSIDVTKVKGRNETVERVQKCDLISSHTARRSFATNLYLMEVPSETIKKVTGHRTEKSFLKYIKLTNRQHAEIIAAKFDEVQKKSFLKVVG
jgi:integrase